MLNPKIIKNFIKNNYSELFNNSINLIYVLDLKGNFIDANDKALSSFGYKKNEISNISFRDLIQKKKIANVFKNHKELTENVNKSKVYEFEIRTKDGRSIYIETYGIPLKNNKVFEGILCIANDITKFKIEKQKLEEYKDKYNKIIKKLKEKDNIFKEYSKSIPEIRFWKLFHPKKYDEALKNSYEMLQNVIDNIPEYIFWKDTDLIYLGCNKNYAKLLGYNNPEDIIGKTDKELFSKKTRKEDFLKRELYVINSIIPEYHIVEEWITKKGNKIWLDIDRIPLYDSTNKSVGILVTYKNITEKIEAEKLIEQEREKLKELEKLKRQLTTQLSEKLKTPISEIHDTTKILINSYKGQLDKSATSLLELIKKGGERSFRMIERIIDISRIEFESFELNKKITNLIDLIINSLNQISDKIQSKNISLNVKLLDDTFAEVDEGRMNKILIYFISNFLKYSPLNGNLLISLRETNNNIEIEIKGKNEGFQELKSEFEYKYAKKILELHQGSIIERKKDKYASIIIRLPSMSWKDLLIHLFVIYKSGILLFEHNFLNEKEDNSPFIISGGLIGIVHLLKEIVKGKKNIKTIDHGDRKIIFQLSQSKDIFFVLIAKEENVILRRKLNTLITNFNIEYKDIISDIESTAMQTKYWVGLEKMITNYF